MRGAGGPADHRKMVARLYRAFEKQLAELERRFFDGGTMAADERDARTLGTLARTLEKLIELQAPAAVADDDGGEQGTDADLADLRQTLARRLRSLGAGGG